jgi:hypothetical protein
MGFIKKDPQKLTVNRNIKHTYEAPAIIYEGTITTRAGTPPGETNDSKSSDSAVDPADLFGD